MPARTGFVRIRKLGDSFKRIDRTDGQVVRSGAKTQPGRCGCHQPGGSVGDVRTLAPEGRRRAKLVPSPVVLIAVAVPPCTSMRLWTMARPLPPVRRSAGYGTSRLARTGRRRVGDSRDGLRLCPCCSSVRPLDSPDDDHERGPSCVDRGGGLLRSPAPARLRYGEGGRNAALIPFSIDGTVLASSMTLLWRADSAGS